MSPHYRTIEQELRHEIDKIKGSRFIATVSPVTSLGDIEAVLQRVRNQLSGANHHCFAYRLGRGRETFRSSDDGEPSGSAGRPILQQIDGRDLTDTLVVVSRLFGGTKLGVGGLVRAYGGAASAALDAARVRTVVLTRTLTVRHPYDCAGAVKSVLASIGLQPASEDYGENVTFVVHVPEDDVQGFVDQVRERTAGRAVIAVE